MPIFNSMPTPKLTATDIGAIPTAEKGKPGGVPTLDKDGKVVQQPSTDYLPIAGGKMKGPIELPGNPTKPLHALPLSAALSDGTKSLLGLSAEAMPDDALIALLLTVKQGCIVKVSVTVGGAPAKAGIEVTGLEAVSGGKCYTDASGLAVGLTATTTTTIATPDYVDIAAVSNTISTPAQTIITATLALGASSAGEKSITTTTPGIRFSPYVTEVDVCCVGGGGGGCNVAGNSGGGGGGGYVSNRLNIKDNLNGTNTAVVGSGGKAGVAYRPDPDTTGGLYYKGGDGGASSFLGVVANGGIGGGSSFTNGGVGNGKGGDGVASGVGNDGGAGTVYAFDDTTDVLYGGGGGGASNNYDLVSSKGGLPYGGNGGYHTTTQPSWPDAGNGRGYGGGGGGAYGYKYYPDYVTETPTKAGNGYQGLVRFRWRVAA